MRDHSQATAFTSEVLSRGDPSHIASVLTSSDGAVLLLLLLSLCYQSLTKPYWLNALGPLRQTRADTHAIILGMIITCRQDSSTFVAVLAAIKLSLPGSRVGLERIVPPSLSCLLPVALGRDEIC